MRRPVSVKAGSQPPWLGLGAATWVQIVGSACSTFALYSSALSLDADRSRLTLLRVVTYDVGENLGLLPTGGALQPALL
jgi:hypothetical protein